MKININSRNIKPLIIKNIPFVLIFILANITVHSWRSVPGTMLSEKFPPFLEKWTDNLSCFTFSLDPWDLFYSLALTAVLKILFYIKAKERKKFRNGEEYGSARWGKAKDIDPYVDFKNFSNNILFTQTERLTMGKPSSPKFARNKNVLVIGGSGSGKTRFFVKPNLMQMHSSYVVTDPKGTVMIECGKMLLRGRDTGRKDKNGKKIYEPYNVKVFNTIDFAKSLHYNPFAYISAKNREKDILKFVEVLIKNTNGNKPAGGDDFWEKAEKLLYTAYIAMIFCFYSEEECNMETLINMINLSECREDDESFKNPIDRQFEFVEYWINEQELPKDTDDYYKAIYQGYKPTEEQKRIGAFAVKQFKAYKLAAGKTAKSILISCSTRLAPFAIDEVLEITRYDELGLDKLGDELSALFVIISDTDTTFNFLVAIMYSQMFNLLCTHADNNPSGKLKYHVRCLLDEFANIGEIPNFDKLIATIRSREISASIILQTKSQLKAIYKDNADTIEGNCDTMLFLGGKEKTTLKEISESLGKETIDSYNTSTNKGQSESFGMNYQKLGKELMSQDELAVMDGSKCILQLRGVRPFFSSKFDITKHTNYNLLSDEHPKNALDIEKYVIGRKKRKYLPKPSDNIMIMEDLKMKNIKTPEEKAKLTRKCKLSKKVILNVTVILAMCAFTTITACAAINTTSFINKATDALKTVIILIGAGLGIWGIVNLLEGYGSDNAGSKSQGMKQLMAGIALIVVAIIVVPELKAMMTAGTTTKAAKIIFPFL